MTNPMLQCSGRSQTHRNVAGTAPVAAPSVAFSATSPVRFATGEESRLLAAVEVIVDELRHSARDARYGREVGERGARDCLGRAEMLQQRALASRADALDFVQWVADDVLLA